MINPIKNNIDKTLYDLINNLNKKYRIKSISPLLFANMENFLLRKGKRFRPILFIIGFKGYCSKTPPHLYRTAVSLELMHSFLLIHDDIIDNAAKRRGKPAMHVLLAGKKDRESGISLALVIGDIVYAFSIEAFMSVKLSNRLKEKALLKFIESGFYTGCGEFIEIINSQKPISRVTEKDIYRTYDYKTAYYSFSVPLVTAAILAGADDNEAEKIFQFGKYCGRAFQIKDDIIGIFANEKKSGKTAFGDILESKKTLLVWHAYKKSKPGDRSKLDKLLKKKKLIRSDIDYLQKLIKKTGSLDYCNLKIDSLFRKAVKKIESCRIKRKYRDLIIDYSYKTLNEPL
jgi:geranylgeranyl diphosphate synthase type I